MKIVIIDDWPDFTEDRLKRLKAIGEVEWVKGRLIPKNDFLKAAKDADIVMVSHHGLAEITREMLDQLPNLKMIAQLATGYDYADLEAIVEKKIILSYVPGYASASVAEHSLGLMLSLSKKICVSYDQMKNQGIFDFRQNKGFELLGKTLGLIGCGHIGRATASRAMALGMNVLAFDKKVPGQVKSASFEEILEKADIISLHVPLNDETKHMFSMEQFKKMKKSALLINTARAPLVNQDDLLKALDAEEIGGYGTDLVLEPFDPKDPMVKHPKVVITPHTAWYTNEAVSRLTEIAVRNVEAFVKGKPKNVVTLDGTR